MDPYDITNITVARPEHCMLVSWELVDRYIYLPQKQEYISCAFSHVFNYTRWKKEEKNCLTSLCWFFLSNGRKVLSPPRRSSWVWWKPSREQKMPAAKLEKEMPLAFKSHYWGSSFLSEEGRKQSFPCWPPMWRIFNNNCFAHASCPFSPGSLWPLPQGPGSRVKGIGVCEPWARGHFRVSLISHRISSRQQKRTRALGKWGSIWSWEREKNQLI